MKENAVGWFEVPVSDMERAMKFYKAVFELDIQRQQMDGLDMGWFPHAPEAYGSGGALVHQPEFYKASTEGVLVYFNAHSGDLAIELGRVEAAGGKVLSEKKLIAPDIGYMGLFLDTEGNRIALHSRK